MKKIKTDFLVVGAGFYGCVLAERIATVLKKKVVILEKRDHIGGNCFSEVDKKTGIEFHKYGTHIFHTSNQNVWNYLKNFTYFNNYRHQVLARFKRKIYQLPINLETINSFFNKDFSPTEAKNFIFKQAKNLAMLNTIILKQRQNLKLVKNYTMHLLEIILINNGVKIQKNYLPQFLIGYH